MTGSPPQLESYYDAFVRRGIFIVQCPVALVEGRWLNARTAAEERPLRPPVQMDARRASEFQMLWLLKQSRPEARPTHHGKEPISP